jgi:hypothetical protein
MIYVKIESDFALRTWIRKDSANFVRGQLCPVVPFPTSSNPPHDLTVTFAARAAVGLGACPVSIATGCSAIAARIGYVSLWSVVTKVFDPIVGAAVVGVTNVCALERCWANPNESDQTMHIAFLYLTLPAEGDAQISVFAKPGFEPATGVLRPYLPITSNRIEILPAWNGTQFFAPDLGHDLPLLMGR